VMANVLFLSVSLRMTVISLD